MISADAGRNGKQRRTCLVFLHRNANDYRNPPSVRWGHGVMDELLDRLVANVGVDRGVAEKAVGIILAFLFKEGPSDKVQALVNLMPGAETAMQAAANEGGTGMGGVMGVGTKLMAVGLSMDQMQSATREIISYSREKLGEDAVGEIVGSIPGLGQFI